MRVVNNQLFLELLRTKHFESGYLPESLHFTPDYILAQVDRQQIAADIYYWEKKPVQNRPAVIFLHGGGFWSGDKKQFQRQAAYLALQLNVFAVSLYYRFSGGAPFPAALQDVKCAVRWVRSISSAYHIDPARIILIGGSPGGNLAALAGVTNGVEAYEGTGGFADFSSDINGAIIFNGVFDFISYIETAEDEKDHVRQYLGGSLADFPEQYVEASPLLRVWQNAVPMLLLHGREDAVIPHEKSVQMHQKLQEKGISSEIAIFDGKGHGWFNRIPDGMDALQRVERFMVERFGCRNRVRISQ